MANKDIVIYFTGGTMTGIIGAKIAKDLQELDIYDRIKAVYGASAGSFNGGFFLAKQMNIGLSIYYENLISNFIYPKRVPYAIAQRYYNRYVKQIDKNKIWNVVDIDYLMEVVTKIKILNTEAIINQPIPFFVKVLDINERKVKFINIKDANPLKLLRASVSVAPYYFSKTRIEGKWYIDPCLKERIGISEILEKHPNDKIIIIDNINHYDRSKLISIIKNFIESFAAYPMFAFNAYEMITAREVGLQNDLEIINRQSNILHIYPDKNFIEPDCVDPKKLLQGFYDSYKYIGTIKRFITPAPDNKK